MTVQFRHGVKPNNPNRPRLYFSAFRKAGVTAPASADYSHIPAIGMLGNDDYGDCVFANCGHLVEQQTYLGQGAEVAVTTADALNAYARVTGFNPNDPSTDQGAEIQAGLDDLRKIGYENRRIAAFAQLNPSAMNDVRLAVAEFGAVSVGFAFPASAMAQFNHGQPWDVVGNDGGIDGGHCVTLVGYDADYLHVFTWGTVQKMTYAFWAKYVFEAWTHADEDWFSTATGKDPEGVDKYAFGAQYAALTGQPNPFPAPPPGPVPPPVPVPGPVTDAAERALADALHRFTRVRRHPAYLVGAAKAWLADKGL
jgi:hypothetical protein